VEGFVLKNVEVVRDGKVVEDKPDLKALEAIKAEISQKPPVVAPVKEASPPTAEEMLAQLKAKKRTRVAIVGFTPSRDQAPYKNPDYEIWALNDLFEAIPRADRIFQIHSRQSIDTYTTRGEHASYIDRLRSLPVPIYMVEAYPDIPNSIAYPIDEMVKKYGPYFTNTISYMIALAVEEGFKEIHIYGVDMAVGVEYIAQRPSCEYHIGIAIGRGIKVFIPHQSDLLKSRFLYGFQEDEEIAFSKKCDASIKMMTDRLNGAIRQENSVTENFFRYDGGIQVVGEVIKKCKDEPTLQQLQKIMADMQRDKQTREDQIKQIHEIVCKYQGAIQAVQEIQKTWSTCLEMPAPMDVVTGEGCPKRPQA
jgi:hypothetical protein